jgi:hypothetical protein
MTRLAESSVLSNISQQSMWGNLTAPIHSNTLTREVHILRHISFQGVNEFLHVMPFSNYQLTENQCSTRHTSIKGVNQMLACIFYIFSSYSDECWQAMSIKMHWVTANFVKSRWKPYLAEKCRRNSNRTYVYLRCGWNLVQHIST